MHATLVAKCMARQHERREMYEALNLKKQVQRNTSTVGIRTNKLLFDACEAGKKLHVLPGSDKYFVVDECWEVSLSLNEASCSCRQYVDTGLPCVHDIAAAFVHPRKRGSDLPEEFSEYADPHYQVETLEKVYKEVIVPCAAGRDLVPDGTTLPQADVPPQAGLPKGKRHRGASDKQLDQKKKAVSTRCSRCRKVLLGHNSRSCKEELEELEHDGLLECNVEDDNKNDEDGAKGGNEEDEEDDNEEDEEDS